MSKEKIEQTDNGQEKEIKVKREDIIYALLCGVVVGLILMGAATIVNGWWAYCLNVISSGGYLVVAICLMLLTFYQNLFCKQKVEKNKLPAKIVATLIYYAIAVLFIFVSWEGLLNKDFSDLTFWLVAISWVLVSVLIIVKQISINKQDFENSPLQSYAYILCGMIYAFAYAVILKFNFDVALKIFYTIHTVVALTVFINIIFRYGIKASNFLQLALFIVSVIMLMALLVSTLYFWFWDPSNTDIFSSIMGVFAGLLGGVLTLTGVAWTIKRQEEVRKEDIAKREKERKQEEIAKAKPIFSHTLLLNKPNLQDKPKCLAQFEKDMVINTYAQIDNSENSAIILKKIYYDKWRDINGNTLILKNRTIYLCFDLKAKNGAEHNIICYLQVQDLLSNNYYYKLRFTQLKDDLNVLFDIQEIPKEEAPDDND